MVNRRQHRPVGLVAWLVVFIRLLEERDGRCLGIGETNLLLLIGFSTAFSASSLLALALLQEGLGNEDLVLGGNGAVGG